MSADVQHGYYDLKVTLLRYGDSQTYTEYTRSRSSSFDGGVVKCENRRRTTPKRGQNELSQENFFIRILFIRRNAYDRNRKTATAGHPTVLLTVYSNIIIENARKNIRNIICSYLFPKLYR